MAEQTTGHSGMTPDEIEALAHRWHREICQEGNLALADQLLAPDVVIHGGGAEFRGVETAKQVAGIYKAALPDLQITHHEAVVAGNRAAILWTVDGTHQGAYLGFPPTGQRLHFEGIDLYHIQGDKITEMWIEVDSLGPLQQAGAIPTPGQAS